MTVHAACAIAIFAGVYAIILAGENSPRKLDRPAAGLIGGLLMVLAGVLSRSQALAAIDFSTLSLLFAMMVVIHFAAASGLIDRIARRAIGAGRSRRGLLWAVCAWAGILSALFVNDTICLLMTPLLLTVARRLKARAEPYLIALATSANAGSVMTLTGNPQNMLIGVSSGWTWGQYALRMAPVGALCLLANGLLARSIYRKDLDGDFEARPEEPARELDRKLSIKTMIVLSGLLIALVAGAPMDLAALTAAVVLIVVANRPPAEAFNAVDWSLLLFFAGLFVVVRGLEQSEGPLAIRMAGRLIRDAPGILGLAKFSAISVAGSNLFSNVPFVMLVRPWIAGARSAPLMWLALAASSTLAGNLTLVGSVANLIVAQRAGDECPLTFASFLRVGVPSTVITVAISVFVLALYHALRWA